MSGYVAVVAVAFVVVCAGLLVQSFLLCRTSKWLLELSRELRAILNESEQSEASE